MYVHQSELLNRFWPERCHKHRILGAIKQMFSRKSSSRGMTRGGWTWNVHLPINTSILIFFSSQNFVKVLLFILKGRLLVLRETENNTKFYANLPERKLGNVKIINLHARTTFASNGKLCIGQIEASACPPPGIPRAFDNFAVPGRREFDYQSLPGGGEFDPNALGVGNLNCTFDFM